MLNPYAGFSNEQLVILLKEIRAELQRRAGMRIEPRRRAGYAKAAEALADAESHLEQ